MVHSDDPDSLDRNQLRRDGERLLDAWPEAETAHGLCVTDAVTPPGERGSGSLAAAAANHKSGAAGTAVWEVVDVAPGGGGEGDAAAARRRVHVGVLR